MEDEGDALMSRLGGSAVGAIALTLAAGAAGIGAQQGLAFPSLPTGLSVGEGQTQRCLTELPGEAVCGRFRVFENRTTQTGRTLDLAFVVFKATGPQPRTDAFTRFRGGPGAPVTPGAAGIANASQAIRAERDILLLDHRGTGNSAPLDCDDPFPGGIPSRFETVFPLDHVRACRDRLSQRTDLSQYTTPNAMDDLADLTRWLGYPQLNVMGGSYGTREVQIFARRHPELVRTAVMNAVAPVDQPVYLYHAKGLQGSLENMIAECEAQPACRNAYPDLVTVLDEVLSTAVNDPPLVTVAGETLRFGIGPLSYALRGLLYGQSGTVPARVYEAHAGNWDRLANIYLQRQAWVGSAGGSPAGYHYSVLCSEDIDPLTWDEIAAESANTFMGDFLIAGYKRACDEWPSAVPAPDYRDPVRSDKPAIFLSGGRDPVTPIAGAMHVATGWPNSKHVVVPYGGHGQGGPCIDGLILELIQSGSAEGLDLTCVSNPPPTRFEILPGR